MLLLTLSFLFQPLRYHQVLFDGVVTLNEPILLDVTFPWLLKCVLAQLSFERPLAPPECVPILPLNEQLPTLLVCVQQLLFQLILFKLLVLQRSSFILILKLIF